MLSAIRRPPLGESCHSKSVDRHDEQASRGGIVSHRTRHSFEGQSVPQLRPPLEKEPRETAFAAAGSGKWIVFAGSSLGVRAIGPS